MADAKPSACKNGEGPKLIAPQGMCSKCKKPCIAATSESKPSKSEWFCMACRISHYMSTEEAENIIAARQRRRQEA